MSNERPNPQLYVVTHEHRHGASGYIMASDHHPSEEEIVKTLDIDFEPDQAETLTVSEAVMPEVGAMCLPFEDVGPIAQAVAAAVVDRGVARSSVLAYLKDRFNEDEFWQQQIGPIVDAMHRAIAPPEDLTEDVIGGDLPQRDFLAPNGVPIVAVLESVHCKANLQAITKRDGKLIYEYDGQTDIFWDEQRPVERDGGPVFLDAEGDEWTARQLLDTKQRDETPAEATP